MTLRPQDVPASRVTPDEVIGLGPDDVFVFGSNLRGRHGRGAALAARERFAATEGVGEGWTGRYALPTVASPRSPLPDGLAELRDVVDRFVAAARGEPRKRLLVTAVGCGLAGYSADDVAPMFRAAAELPNVCLPESFWSRLCDHHSHAESANRYGEGDPCRLHRLGACAAHDRSAASALIVGERYNTDPSMHAAGWPPLFERRPYLGLTRSGAFLWGSGRRRLLQLGVRWLRSANLLWPAPAGDWDAAAASAWARRLLADPATSTHRLLWLCGVRVAAAFGLGGAAPMSLHRRDGLVLAVLPHPSGRSRIWNDPASPELCRRFVREAYDAVAAGP